MSWKRGLYRQPYMLFLLWSILLVSINGDTKVNAFKRKAVGDTANPVRYTAQNPASRIN